jgi:hypothetical protein
MNSSIVSRAEYDFLSVAQAIVRKGHVSSIDTLLRSSISLPQTISPTAMHIFTVKKTEQISSMASSRTVQTALFTLCI